VTPVTHATDPVRKSAQFIGKIILRAKLSVWKSERLGLATTPDP